ncbi:alpha-amylase family glycosyl hydrolase [Planococcus salinus]|uniref:Alpha-amlyase n=1 Tax=Planococcus salinus TaxID=1848460 RepID=A0A3M8P414_9BACL|nr:alpha-amylase family glycosyl hydrolase [Planococcus salinus]RNF38141.1 alpha-amlyase [Planococcus salinus]
MKVKWISSIAAAVMSLSLISPAAAEETRTLQDESIYDVLVDRFFNQKIDNDFEVDSTNPAAFNGGDFAGLAGEISHIQKLGFTTLSVGPVFASATYDGKEVLDYSQLERHFGTPEEFQNLIDEANDQDIKIMVDIPTQQVSSDHIWVSTNPGWFTENEDGTYALNTADEEAQSALIATLSEFVKEYEVGAMRLQNTDSLDADFIEEFSRAIKEVRDIYLLADREMEPVPGLDATVLPGVEESLRSSYKNFDQGSEELTRLIEEGEGRLIQVDSLWGSRFTADVVEERGFPPTRWTLLFTQLLTMPGIPVVQYGSEIAMNGTVLPESHQIMDFSVQEELIDHIANLNSLRNSSEALRTGDTEVLHEEDGWIVYSRSNEEETWVVAINNSSSTQHMTVPAEVAGKGKEMRGLFGGDIVREEDDGAYRITLDREVAEVFHVTDERGLNTAYFVALAVLYIVFMIFLWIVWRKGKQRKADEARKNSLE